MRVDESFDMKESSFINNMKNVDENVDHQMCLLITDLKLFMEQKDYEKFNKNCEHILSFMYKHYNYDISFLERFDKHSLDLLVNCYMKLDETAKLSLNLLYFFC